MKTSRAWTTKMTTVILNNKILMEFERSRYVVCNRIVYMLYRLSVNHC